MIKKLRVCFILIILIVTILTVVYNYKSFLVSTIVNNEQYINCYLINYNGSSNGVFIESKEDILNIFNTFMNKRIRRILPWEKRSYKSYYSISTEDNWITIYDHEYFSILVDSQRKYYKIIDPIDAKVFNEYLEK